MWVLKLLLGKGSKLESGVGVEVGRGVAAGVDVRE